MNRAVSSRTAVYVYYRAQPSIYIIVVVLANARVRIL